MTGAGHVRKKIGQHRVAAPCMRASYDNGVSATPLLGETVAENLDRTTAVHPEALALVSRHQHLRYTYTELNDSVDAVARGLLAAGLERGDRLGLWSPNCAEWVMVQYAAAKVGAVLVNLNPGYRQSEVEHALNTAETVLLIAATTFKGSDYVVMAEAARSSVASLRRVVHLETPGWEEFVSDGDALPNPAVSDRMDFVEFDDPASIQFTSGTTGAPKGTTLTHHNILNNAYFIAEGLRYTEADRVCIPVPFYHNFGMVLGNLGCTTHGSCIVIPSASFDAGAVLDAIDGERCTSLYGVPTMFIAELEHPRLASADLSSLRTGIMAGSPCPIELMKRVCGRLHIPEIAICYGMTESSSVTTQTALTDSLERRVTTVGKVHPHVEIKVVDPDSGRVVTRGKPGELLTRGYNVMLGYWNDPERTRATIDPQRWLHTGDVATMDADGYVNVVGRIKDMIIRGGENIFPSEIEQFLHTHADVVDAAVVGVPDERYGEQVLAWIIPRAGMRLTEAAIQDYCRGQIAHFKVPRYVRFTDVFPETVTGKTRKVVLRELAVDALGLGAEHAEPSA